jgi:hypothetical protein
MSNNIESIKVDLLNLMLNDMHIAINFDKAINDPNYELLREIQKDLIAIKNNYKNINLIKTIQYIDNYIFELFNK